MFERKTILLIEDNPDDERLTLRALRKNNVSNEVVVACDGKDAFDLLYAKTDAIRPSLIVVDLKLPGVTGFEVIERIRSEASTRTTPIVVLTSSADAGDMIRSYELGANSFVRKPVDATEFSEVVMQVAMYWLLLNEPAFTPQFA